VLHCSLLYTKPVSCNRKLAVLTFREYMLETKNSMKYFWMGYKVSKELISLLPVCKLEYMPYLMEQMIQFCTLTTTYAKITIV